MWCVWTQLYMDQTKKIFDHFICISLFKHVLCWKTSVRIFGYSFWLLSQVASFGYSFWQLAQSRNPSCKFIQKLLLLIHNSRKFLQLISQFSSCKTPRNSFLKCYSWKTCFKPLPSSLKPLFQYFYIKTPSIWMVFHSINISKVILNSFHYFGSLDYVLESFVLLFGIFIIRVGKTYFFVKFLYEIGFFLWFALDVGPLWQKEHVLKVDFMMFMHYFTLLFIVCTLGVW